MVTWLAHQQQMDHRLLLRQAAWYVKEQPTFSDALAWVRRDLWNHVPFCTLSPETEGRKLQEHLLQRFAATLCYAA